MSEINVAQIESTPTTVKRITSAARFRGYELDSSRKENLLKVIEINSKIPENDRLVFHENGLMIRRPLLSSVSGIKPCQISFLDFLPIVDKDSDIVANPHPQRGSTTQITLMGIEAFQDFILMADAGLVPKPNKFFGTTNPTMAKFARRVGFESVPKLAEGVIADYDAVAERIFSPEIIDVQRRLEMRQTALAAGNLALIKS